MLGGKSLYEAHVNARAKVENYTLTETGQRVKISALIYDRYPIPRFNDYLSYFTTRHQQTGSDEAAIMSRRGLADYSNRSFFTIRTNVTPAPNPNYTLPPNSLPAYGTMTKTTGWDGRALPNGGTAQLLTLDVRDSLFPAETEFDIPLTTYGLWDQYLNDEGFVRRYSLNLHNYNAMADLLIPRAVAYSAGFLDYFFRGRMDIAEPDEGLYAVIDHSEEHTVVNGVPYKGDGSNPNPGNVFGFDKIRAKVRNATPAINDGTGTFPQNFSNGELLAVARFRTNPCYLPDLSGEFIDGGTIPNGCDSDLILNSPRQVLLSAPITLSDLDSTSYTTFDFDFRSNPIPVNATDLYLQLVYRGELGSEQDAVVIATKDLYEPSYYSFANNTDFVNVEGALRRSEDIAQWANIRKAVDESPQGNSNGILDESVDPVPAEQLTLSFNGSQTPTISLGTLPAIRYIRLAALSDKDSFTVASSTNIGQGTETNVSTFKSALNQFLLDTNNVRLYRFRPMSELRGYRYYSLENLFITYGLTDTISNTAYMDTIPAIGNQLLPYPVDINTVFTW